MERKRALLITRWSVRLTAVGAALLLAAGGPLPAWTARWIPALSPLAAATGIISQRAFYTVAGLVPAALIALIAVFRGRWFCRWICPAGTLYSLVSPCKTRIRLLKEPVAGVIFWALIAAAALGYPLLIFLDPLSTFSRNAVWTGGPLTWAALIPGLLLPLLLLLSVFQPVIWCSHCCPLGYFFSLVDYRRMNNGQRFKQERRRFLAGIAIGTPLALVAVRLPGRSAAYPILPPGAIDGRHFGAVCSRCYACVRACPTGILGAEFHPERPISDWFAPEMNPSRGPCEETCRACTRACPTGAIRKLDKVGKRHRQIGIAEVRRQACLAWYDGQYCMVCAQYCPYDAIDADIREDGLPRPVVDTELCRGCGYCQNVCPAERRGVAIKVDGLLNQRELPSARIIHENG